MFSLYLCGFSLLQSSACIAQLVTRMQHFLEPKQVLIKQYHVVETQHKAVCPESASCVCAPGVYPGV